MSSSIKGSASLVFACVCAAALSADIALAQTVIKTIPVAGFAGGGAVDYIAKRAYIPTGAGSNGIGQVTVINEKTSTIAGIITLPTPWQVTSTALNPLTGLLYVGAENGGLYVVDPKTYQTVGFVNVNAVSVALNPLTNKIYASDFNSNLYVIDGFTNNIEATVTLNGIQNIAVNPFTNRIYAALQYFAPGQVAVVDGTTNAVIAQVPAGSGLSFSVAVDVARNLFYSAEQFGTVTVYDGKTNTPIKSIAINGQPSGLSVDPIKREIYVSDFAHNRLVTIDGKTNTIEGSIAVGNQPEYSTLDPFFKRLYVGTESIDNNGNPTFGLTAVRTE